MSTQTPPTFADLVKAATSSDAPQVPPAGNPASSGSFDDLVKAATSPKESTQSPEKAPVVGAEAGLTGSGTRSDLPAQRPPGMPELVRPDMPQASTPEQDAALDNIGGPPQEGQQIGGVSLIQQPKRGMRMTLPTYTIGQDLKVREVRKPSMAEDSFVRTQQRESERAKEAMAKEQAASEWRRQLDPTKEDDPQVRDRIMGEKQALDEQLSLANQYDPVAPDQRGVFAGYFEQPQPHDMGGYVFDQRDDKILKDYVQHLQMHGDGQYKTSTTLGALQAGRESAIDRFADYYKDALQTQTDALNGRVTRLYQMRERGADPQMLQQEAADIEAGYEFVQARMDDWVKNAPKSEVRKAIEQRQKETNEEYDRIKDDWFTPLYATKKGLHAAQLGWNEMLFGSAAGIARAFGDKENYDWSDDVSDYVDRATKMNESALPTEWQQPFSRTVKSPISGKETTKYNILPSLIRGGGGMAALMATGNLAAAGGRALGMALGRGVVGAAGGGANVALSEATMTGVGRASALAGELPGYGQNAGFTAGMFFPEYESYVRQAMDGGVPEKLASDAGLFYALGSAYIERLNPQLYVGGKKAFRTAFTQAIRDGKGPKAALGDGLRQIGIQGGKEGTEELMQGELMRKTNLAVNMLTGADLESATTLREKMNEFGTGAILGSIAALPSNGVARQKRTLAEKESLAFAAEYPEFAAEVIRRDVPEAQQKEFLDKLEKLNKLYVGNGLTDLPVDNADRVAQALAKKKDLQEQIKKAPIADALRSAKGDPREVEVNKLNVDVLREMNVPEDDIALVLASEGVINLPDGAKVTKGADGKLTLDIKEPKEGEPAVSKEDVLSGLVKQVHGIAGERTTAAAKEAKKAPDKDPDEEVEIAPVGDATDLDAALASVTPGMNKALDSEVEAAAKSLSGVGVKVVVHDDIKSFASAFEQAGGSKSVDHLNHEGFYDRGGRTIHINRTNNRSGLAAHEGVHALFMGALSDVANGRQIIAEAARQVMNESPETRSSIARFLESYGGAIRKEDGSIDIEATVADPKLAHEIYAEFVSSVANGTIKLNGGLRTWLKDMYNKIMATLGVSMKFDPKSDDDYIKLAADLASAMKTGRVIRAAENVAENTAPALSVRRASDLAQQLNIASTGAEKEFFGKTWPGLLRQVGNVFKPTKAGFEAAADLAVKDVEEFTRENPKYQDFYNKDWALAVAMLNDAFPITKEQPDLVLAFRAMSGLTSPQTSLGQNMVEAVSAFDHWLNNGSFDAVKVVPTEKGNFSLKKSPFSLGGKTATNKARSLKGLGKLIDENGVGKAIEILKEPVSAKELNEFNGSLGYKSAVGGMKAVKNVVLSATGQSDKVPRMFVFGPKLGAYTLNSLGDGRFTTIDIWESRFIRSYFPRMFASAGGKILNNSTDSDIFTEFIEQFAKAFRERNGFDLDPSAYQAMRWYTMIDAAQKAGYTKALTDGTVSDYTAEALGRVKGHVVPGYAGRGGFDSYQSNDPEAENYVPFSIRRGSPGGDTGGRAEPGKNLIPKDIRKNLTSDGDGSYLFYHYGEDLNGGRINPKYAGTGADKGTRNEGRNNNVSMYYTKPDERESMVSGDVHVVKVPEYKVYPFNTDPLGLYDKAERMFRKDYGDYIDFSPVKQADYMGPLAAKAGFDMMVAQWSKFPLRGETTKALKWDREATDKARDPALSTGSQKFNDIARALIAAGHNTKAKAKAYLKSKGQDGIIDAVIEEMGRILEAQREIRKRNAADNKLSGETTTPLQKQIIDDSGPGQNRSMITVDERMLLKDRIKREAQLAAQSARKAATAARNAADLAQTHTDQGYRQGLAEGQLAGEISGKAQGRKEGAREGAAEAARQRDLFVKSVRAHLSELGTKFTEAKTKAIMTRAVSVNPTNRNQVERFLAYLDAKIDEANEAALGSAVDRIIELTNPSRYKQTNESGILKGKIDDRVRKLLGVIHSAVKGMTLEEVSDKIDAIDAALFSPDADVALLEDQLEAYRIAHGALSGDPEGVAGAEEAVKQIIAEGRSKFREVLAAKHERYVAMRQDAISAITGDKGIKSGFEEVKLEEKKRNFLNHMLDGIGSYLDMNEGLRTLLDKIDKSARGGDPWSGKLDQFYRKVANSRNTMNTRAISTLDEMRAKLEDIYGGKKEVARAVNENSKVKSLGNFTDLNGNNVEMLLSQNRAYYLYNLMKSPENEATFREMGFTDEMKNAVVDFMTPEVKEWADWQTDVFYKNMYNDVNEVYKGLNYIDLPKNKYFTPIRRVGVDDSAPVEVGKFQRSAAGVVNGSLKERTGSTKPFDLTTDGDSVLYQYVAAMNHYIAFAETVRDLNATFGSSDVRKAISQNANSKDNDIISGFIDALANDGRNRALSIGFWQKIRGLHATAKLSLNMVVALKQLSAMPAYMTDLSPKDFAVGLMDFMRHPIEASNILMESSYIQERYKSGFDRDMAIAMARDYQKAFSGKSTLMDKLMFNVRWGDKAAVFSGGWAVYKYHHDKEIKAGKSEAEAKRIGLSEMDEATKMSQQSTGTEDLSAFQRAGEAFKWFTMYKTNPMAFFRQERKGVRDMVRGLKSGDKTLAGDGFRRFIVYHFVLPAVFQFVVNALPGVLTSSDDDDDKDMLRALALGSMNGLFIMGDFMEWIGDRLTGKPWATHKGSQAVEVPIFKSMSDMIASIGDVIESWKNDDDELTKNIMETLLEAGDASGIPAKRAAKMMENGRFTMEYWDQLTPGERAALISGYDPREMGDGYGGHLQNPENQ